MTYVYMRCVDSSISTIIDAIYVEYYVITTRYSKLSLETVFDPTSWCELFVPQPSEVSLLYKTCGSR